MVHVHIKAVHLSSAQVHTYQCSTSQAGLPLRTRWHAWPCHMEAISRTPDLTPITSTQAQHRCKKLLLPQVPKTATLSGQSENVPSQLVTYQATRFTKSLVLFGGWQAACRLHCYKIPGNVHSSRGQNLDHLQSNRSMSSNKSRVLADPGLSSVHKQSEEAGKRRVSLPSAMAHNMGADKSATSDVVSKAA
jgi:hypothetical protein